MFCSNCGSQLGANDKFCSQCGHKVEYATKTEDELMPTHIEMPDDMIIPDVSYYTPKKRKHTVQNGKQKQAYDNGSQTTKTQSVNADKRNNNIVYMLPIAVVAVMIALVIWFVVIPVFTPEKDDVSYIQNTEVTVHTTYK